MNGYFLLNKPKGISSFKALIIARDSLSKDTGIPFKKIKVGHAGTLDPLAEGLLLCAVGKSTKMLSHLLLADKKYKATLFLGKISETDDDEGEKKIPEYFQNKIPSQSDIEKILQKYTGEIMQTPPIFSALKVKGKRSCDRVRAGESPEDIEKMEEIMKKKSKIITIFDIQITQYSYPHLTIEVHCGTGTYIRSLARDIGKDLHQGAYLSFLQRTDIGDFSLDASIEPKNCTEKNIISFSPQHFNMPSYILDEKTLFRLSQGQKVNQKDCDMTICSSFSSESHEQILFWNAKKELIGMGEKREEVFIPRKILQ